MKKTVYALLTIVVITFLLYLYIESNFYKGIVEVCLSDYYPIGETIEALEQAKIYDYLIIFDLYNKENSKVYKGNINIILDGKIKEKTNIELSEYEALMGDEFAGKNYEYYPLGKEHVFNNKEYRINAILRDSSDIYYNDLSMLENQNVKRQRIYAVLKDKEGVEVDENTFLSILKSRNISVVSHIYYNNLGKLLLKVAIICCIVLIVYVIFILKEALKSQFNNLMSGYKVCKYDIDILGYIKKRENSRMIKGIILYSGAIIISILCCMFLTVNFINIRMPYRYNPVSPKSIYGIKRSFCDFLSYYLYNGLTEMSFFVLKIVFVYFMVIFMVIFINVTKQIIKNKSNCCFMLKIFDK